MPCQGWHWIGGGTAWARECEGRPARQGWRGACPRNSPAGCADAGPQGFPGVVQETNVRVARAGNRGGCVIEISDPGASINTPLAACVANGATGAMLSINLPALVAPGMCVLGKRLCGNMGVDWRASKLRASPD